MQNIYLDDRTIRLQLWDTAGQERFRALIPAYIRDCAVAICVYDVTNRRSFAACQQWIDEVRAERGQDVAVVLVGNKADLGGERLVSAEEGEAKAMEMGIPKELFMETSAKSGMNVKMVFKQVVQAALRQERAKAGSRGETGAEGEVDIGTSSSQVVNNVVGKTISASQLSAPATANPTTTAGCCS